MYRYVTVNSPSQLDDLENQQVADPAAVNCCYPIRRETNQLSDDERILAFEPLTTALVWVARPQMTL